MRLDVFAKQDYEKCYVVFSDNTTIWWLRFLKPGFRHCYLLLKMKNSGMWIELNPFSNQTAVFVYDYPIDFDFADYHAKIVIFPETAPVLRRDFIPGFSFIFRYRK